MNLIFVWTLKDVVGTFLIATIIIIYASIGVVDYIKRKKRRK